jgi:hypothetical protein
MSQVRLPIFWKDQVVGFIEDPRSDMPFLYGKWVPEDTITTQEFLTFLQEGEQLWVVVGDGINGTVEEYPYEEIEIKHWPKDD